MKLLLLSSALVATQAATTWKGWSPRQLRKVWRRNRATGWRWKKVTQGALLKKCEGDCDADRDCTGSLKCYQSNSRTFLSSCTGITHSNADYCYDPADVINAGEKKQIGTHGHNTQFAFKGGIKIGLCQGDCDRDSHCAAGLKCLQSNVAGTFLSGCNGKTYSDFDYCYDPKMITTDAKKLQEHGFNAHQFQNTKVAGVAGRVGKIGLCNGDCDRDDQCRAGLKCYQSHSNGDTLSGCAGKTVGSFDYCYDPKLVTTNSKKLENHGWQAHTMGQIGMCKGDCDRDSQCAGTMKCYQSNKSGNVVTGCDAAVKTSGATDYCYQPNRGDAVHCHDWNCAEWCKYFDDALVDTYAKEGCADDGTDSCACP